MDRGAWGLQSIGLQSRIWLKLLSTAPFAYTHFSVSKMLLVKNQRIELYQIKLKDSCYLVESLIGIISLFAHMLYDLW